MEDIKVEPLVRKRKGMQPVTVCNDIRVTHLPTGLVIEVPHEFTRSQNQSLKTAIAMLEAVVPNAAGCSAKQDELAEKHGTPEQFEKAVWKAYSDLFGSQEEAVSAIRKYRNEWESASIK
jgi:protein subunit release factor A